MALQMKRTMLFCCGWLALGVGIVGAVLPLLPTTPFVLLAAVCFSHSSPRFHSWLLQSALFGPMIKDWQARGAICRRAKINATLSMLIVGGLSIWIMNVPLIGSICILIIFACVLTFIWTRPD